MRFVISPEFTGEGVLKAQSGKVYRSLDARCGACKVKGGPEEPCWPAHMRVPDNPHGYPCPRREWPDDDSPALAQLAALGAHGDKAGHLFRLRWDLEFGRRPDAEQLRLLNRMQAAYGDEAIAAHYWPKG